MTQHVINRIESKIFFTSDAFVHEIEYEVKAGEIILRPRVTMY